MFSIVELSLNCPTSQIYYRPPSLIILTESPLCIPIVSSLFIKVLSLAIFSFHPLNFLNDIFKMIFHLVIIASTIIYNLIFSKLISLTHNFPSNSKTLISISFGSYLHRYPLWNSASTKGKVKFIIIPNKALPFHLYFSPVHIIILKSQNQSCPFGYLSSCISQDFPPSQSACSSDSTV